MTEKIDLIEEIQRVSPFSHILIATFRYSQQFFEKQIFPHFKDKTLPLILVDYKEYQNNALGFGTSKILGRKYFIESIKHEKKKIFHPKLFLAANDNEIMMLIGSNNLTYEGYKKNAELVVSVIINFNTGENIELINDILDFIENTLDIIGEQYRNYLIKFINTFKKYQRKSLEVKDKSSWILHNIKESFLKRIQETIKEDIQEMFVISPYFSLDKNFYQIISEFCPNINIIIQQGTSNLPTDILKDYEQIKYFQLIIGEENDRFLHSKLLLIKTETISYYFCSSANFTRPALLSNENIELGILSKLDLSLDEFIRNIGKLKRINLNDIKTTELKVSDDVLRGIDFTISEAYREGNFLIFKISEDLDSIPGDVILYLNNKQKDYRIEQVGDRLKVKVPSEEEEILSNSLVARIIIKASSGERSSDYRVIKNQQIFPERFDFLNSYNINDANYFHKILDKLVKMPNPSEYIPILDILIEQDIFSLSEREAEILKLRNKISRTERSKHRLKLSFLLEKIQKKHEKRIENAIKYKETKFSIEDLNSFIFTNKAILWAVSKDKNCQIEELRKIKINIEKMFGEYIKILINANKSNLIKNSKLRYHLLILTYIIDFLQSNSEKFKPDPRIGYNPVKQVFERTTISQLYHICGYEGYSFAEYMILRLVEEYGQILKEILNVKPKNIIYKINVLAKKLSNNAKLGYSNMLSLDSLNEEHS